MLTVPRLSMAMAERGDFPAFFARVHPVLRTPWVSILLFAVVSWTLANQAGLLENLSLASVSRLFVYGLVCAALPILRSKEGGDVPPPLFRAPMGVGLAIIGVAISLTLATRINLREAVTLGLTVAMATGYWLVTRSFSRNS
jgi:amino acid transporter